MYQIGEDELLDLIRAVYEKGCYGFMDLCDEVVQEVREVLEKNKIPPPVIYPLFEEENVRETIASSEYPVLTFDLGDYDEEG